MDRRNFLMTGLAAFGLTATGASAQAALVPPPTIVPLRAPLPPNQIHVFPDHFRLYHTRPDSTAVRYACRVGRAGLYEPGQFYVGAKKEWPSWRPTPDMVEREPELYAQYEEDGMPGGPGNPLGARALYLFQPGRGDTFLRIHGTNQPGTIGRAVSNGCAGLLNDHIMILYPEVPMDTSVVLYPKMIAA
ncbi:L,D-transpeptidase-like protein [Palleronia aestuarii]|uniref:L,D-transpeptidase-like protein n=1 Tax=Palleronia aestuarii TaxID=568105 RepID=A0A2W7P5Y8_9RHOB|nr:L,D-transpeptidase [Palleronia aestuarii]PZX18822.1 L,D-transpeptidase-like protein [Palleronia aestuarii]